MSSIYYPDDANCGVGELTPYSCDVCFDPEFGRIRSAFMYRDSYSFVNPSSTDEWRNLILAGDARVVTATQGNYDGGETADIPGFGDQATANGSTTHTAVFRDSVVLNNCDFYNSLAQQNQWKFGFRTKRYIYLPDEVANFKTKLVVQDDIASIVVYEVTVTWDSPLLPCPYITPAGIFDRCYDIAQ